MDVDRFETLLRSLAASPSRRQALGLLGGSLLGGMLTHGISPTDAKKRKGKGKKKKSNRGQAPVGCTPSCGGKLCGDNGCGGSCGSCSGGKACQSGTCQCLAGTEDCQGSCIPTTAECCVTADCGGGEICVQNVCVTGQGNCADGRNSCTQGPSSCNGSCLCLQSKEGETRCGGNQIGNCGTCQTSADCVALHPDIPGIFCVNGIAPCCSTGQNFCVPPCAS